MKPIYALLAEGKPGVESFLLVASLYLNEPDRPFVEKIQFSLNGLMDREADSSAALLRDYHDLFVVPVSGRYLPPYESAQRDGRLWGGLTHKVNQLYEETGFDICKYPASSLWLSKPIPDHIGFELSFFAALLNSCLAAPAQQRELLEDTLVYFWDQHLVKWVPSYGNLVTEKANTELYRLLGEMTKVLMNPVDCLGI